MATSGSDRSLLLCPICNEMKYFRKFSRDSRNHYTRTICTDCALQQITASGMQECKSCGEVKAISHFHKDARRSTRLQGICKDCQRVKMRNYFLQRKYGISPEQYDAMYDAQNGLCMICSTPGLCDSTRLRKDRKRAPRVMISSLYVDHDHHTGEVRGLLCPNCNRVLGLVYDNADLLRSALDYLAYFRKEQSA